MCMIMYDVLCLDMGSPASGYESVLSCFGPCNKAPSLALGPVERSAPFLTGGWYLVVALDRPSHDVYIVQSVMTECCPPALVANSAILPFSHGPVARRATARGQAPHLTYLGTSCGNTVRICSLRELYIEVFVYIDCQPLCDMPRSWSPFGPPRHQPFLVGGISNLAGSWLVPASWAPRKFVPRGRQGYVRAASRGWKKRGPSAGDRELTVVWISTLSGNIDRSRRRARGLSSHQKPPKTRGWCVNNPAGRLLSTHPPGERRQSQKTAGHKDADVRLWHRTGRFQLVAPGLLERWSWSLLRETCSCATGTETVSLLRKCIMHLDIDLNQSKQHTTPSLGSIGLAGNVSFMVSMVLRLDVGFISCHS
jgi:hypothetical protein